MKLLNILVSVIFALTRVVEDHYIISSICKTVEHSGNNIVITNPSKFFML